MSALTLSMAIPGMSAFQDLLQQGGPVVFVLACTSLLLWILIVERYWFILRDFPSRHALEVGHWRQREDRSSWRAKALRQQTISQASISLHQGLPVINALVAICPLLGLLGTVTGMIMVFDVIAISRSADPQAMAEGISRATVPTVVGLVVALSALYFNARLKTLAERATEHLADQLCLQQEPSA